MRHALILLLKHAALFLIILRNAEKQIHQQNTNLNGFHDEKKENRTQPLFYSVNGKILLRENLKF